METETKQISPAMTFGIYLLLCVLTVTSIVVLIFYFSGMMKADYTRGERMGIGFGIGFLISLAIAGIFTWRATAEPSSDDDDEDGEEEEEVEDEEE